MQGKLEEPRALWWWGLRGDALGLRLLPSPVSKMGDKGGLHVLWLGHP